MYLEVFKIYDGTISSEIFELLPLVYNYESSADFVKNLRAANINKKQLVKDLLSDDDDLTNKKDRFFKDISIADFSSSDSDYFKSAKGLQAHHIVIDLYKKLLKIRNKTYDKSAFKDLYSSKINGKTNHYRALYLKHLFKGTQLTKKSYFNLYKSLIKIATNSW